MLGFVYCRRGDTHYCHHFKRSLAQLLKSLEFKTMKEMLYGLVPSYHDHSASPLLMKFKWDPQIVEYLERIGPRRSRNRLESYIIPGELERAAEMNRTMPSAGASIRFGNVKKGKGYLAKRRDFCLIGGAYRAKNLTLFYRRLERLGGLFYDLIVIREVERKIGPINKVTVFAVQSNTYARKGGSNEKLYKRLKDHFR